MKKKNAFLFFSNNQGFGLIEATISIGIVTIFIVAFTSLIVQAIKTSSINNNELKATMYLQELIEISKDLEQTETGWDTLTLASSFCGQPPFCHPEIQQDPDTPTDRWWGLSLGPESPESGFTRSLSIVVIPNSGIPGVEAKQITATVEWDNGSQQRIMASNLYYKPTP